MEPNLREKQGKPLKNNKETDSNIQTLQTYNYDNKLNNHSSLCH